MENFNFQEERSAVANGQFAEIDIKEAKIKIKAELTDEGAYKNVTKAGKEHWFKNIDYIVGRVVNITMGKDFFGNATIITTLTSPTESWKLTMRKDYSQDFIACLKRADLSQAIIVKPYKDGNYCRIQCHYLPTTKGTAPTPISNKDLEGAPERVWDKDAGKPDELAQAMRNKFYDGILKNIITLVADSKPALKDIKAEIKEMKKEVKKQNANTEPASEEKDFFDDDFTV